MYLRYSKNINIFKMKSKNSFSIQKYNYKKQYHKMGITEQPSLISFVNDAFLTVRQ